jgi:hypothetical protein
MKVTQLDILKSFWNVVCKSFLNIFFHNLRYEQSAGQFLVSCSNDSFHSQEDNNRWFGDAEVMVYFSGGEGFFKPFNWGS